MYVCVYVCDGDGFTSRDDGDADNNNIQNNNNIKNNSHSIVITIDIASEAIESSRFEYCTANQWVV